MESATINILTCHLKYNHSPITELHYLQFCPESILPILFILLIFLDREYFAFDDQSCRRART